MAHFYEEIFIPDPIREADINLIRNRPEPVFNNPEPAGNPGMNYEPELTIEPELPAEPAPLTEAGGVRGRVILKNHFRLVVFCDKINLYLYLDLIGRRSELGRLYDKYGRLKRGAAAKLSDDYKIYRLIDDETGQTYYIKMQMITSSRSDRALGFVYSRWETLGSSMPAAVGITY